MQYSLEARGFSNMANGRSIDRINRTSNLTVGEIFYRWRNVVIGKRYAVQS